MLRSLCCQNRAKMSIFFFFFFGNGLIMPSTVRIHKIIINMCVSHYLTSRWFLLSLLHLSVLPFCIQLFHDTTVELSIFDMNTPLKHLLPIVFVPG